MRDDERSPLSMAAPSAMILGPCDDAFVWLFLSVVTEDRCRLKERRGASNPIIPKKVQVLVLV